MIVIYPDFDSKADIADSNGIRKQVRDLWNLLPIFRDNMHKVPTIHVPYKKNLIKAALEDERFMVNSKKDRKDYYFTV